MQIEAKITVYSHFINGSKPPKVEPLKIKPTNRSDRAMLELGDQSFEVDAAELIKAVQRVA